jgi:two-component system response regulator
VLPDGEQAIKFLSGCKTPPVAILLDLNLPKIPGLDVLQYVKRSKALRCIPVVVLTNSTSKRDVVEAYRQHANAYIRKPVGYDELLGILKVTWQFWLETATLTSSVADQSTPIPTQPPTE